MNPRLCACLATVLIALPVTAAPAKPKPVHRHNLILFVADGLRAASVDAAPDSAFAQLRADGVAFPNSHALFPTFTTANASALATGHYLGDTGDFSNTILAHRDHQALDGVIGAVPFLERDDTLRLLNKKYGGDFTGEESLIEAAVRSGYPVAVVGKVGPAAIQNLAGLTDGKALIIDDAMGSDGSKDHGTVVPPGWRQPMLDWCKSTNTPEEDCFKALAPATPNTAQQQQFAYLVTKVILPQLALQAQTQAKPFLLVYWSRDPDRSQHTQTDDQPGKPPLGINGATSLRAVANAAQNLAQIRQALSEMAIDAGTNVIVTADHGFSTIDKSAHGSWAAGADSKEPGVLPQGFLASDLAHQLNLSLFDPDDVTLPQVKPGERPKAANGFIGASADAPQVIVAGNGGSDLIYLTGSLRQRQSMAAKLVPFLAGQAYISGIFVDDALGGYAAALPMSSIGLCGAAKTPTPSITVSFASSTALCNANPDAPLNPELCGYEVADTAYKQNQGMHGGFSRADTHNFTAAAGPDFKGGGYADPMPVSNADIAVTIADLLGLKPQQHGAHRGRVLAEAYVGGKEQPFRHSVLRSATGQNGVVTVLAGQSVGSVQYFDAAGFTGRTVGLDTAIGDGKARVVKPLPACGAAN